MKLIRFLVLNNIASRRKAIELLKKNEIKVNNKIVGNSTNEIDIETDIVSYNGKQYKGIPDFYYLVVNKPREIVITKSDPQHRKTIYDLIYEKRLFKIAANILWFDLSESAIYRKYKEFKKLNMLYAGRLDFNTMGLLLMSNDSELINKLSHPTNKIKKYYRVKVYKHLSQKQIEIFKKGVYVKVPVNSKEKVVKFTCNFERIKPQRSDMILYISIYSGENRIIRRAFAQMGHPVVTLKRTQEGPIKLRGLKIGEYRFLSKEEVKTLKKI
jgi:pseudouridine synthase